MNQVIAHKTPCVLAHGAEIPAIGLGTYPMRGERCVAAVETALVYGYRHIDTASGYQNEAEVGQGIRGAGIPREDIFVTTKITPWDLAEGDMQRAVERSLKALGLDVADLILIHWPSRTIPAAETVRTLNDVKRRGLARHIGVSNYTVALLEEAWAATEEPLAVNQCEFHPYLDQQRLRAACRARGMAFTAYAPLGQGAELKDPAVTGIARALGRTPAQVLLRWALQHEGTCAIPKSATPSRIRENLAVFDFSLSAEQMDVLSGLARPGSRIIADPDLAPAWDE